MAMPPSNAKHFIAVLNIVLSFAVSVAVPTGAKHRPPAAVLRSSSHPDTRPTGAAIPAGHERLIDARQANRARAIAAGGEIQKNYSKCEFCHATGQRGEPI